VSSLSPLAGTNSCFQSENDKDKGKNKNRNKDMYKDKSASEAPIGMIWDEQGHGKPARTRVSRKLDMISLNIS
jgi:hypothetical protein